VAVEHPIRAASQLTGLSVDTLRAWERRYRAVVPIRTQRGRAYTTRHIQRLRLLRALVETGHAIGSIAGLPDADLRKLSPIPEAVDRTGIAPTMADAAALRQALARYDSAAVEHLVARHALMLPPGELVCRVIAPALRDAGTQWEAGHICVAQEHLLSGAVRNVLGSLLRVLPRRAGAAKLMFASPAGELHELGLLSAAVLAATAGCDVVYLGPNLPSADIAHAVKTLKPSVLVLAAAAGCPSSDEINRLKRLPSRLSIWVGGAQSAALQQQLGRRALRVDSLDAFRDLLERHAT